MSQRVIPMQGAVNFRDIGGYPAGPVQNLRWQRIYRSDSLAELTAEDQARLLELDLYGIVDYRLQAEAAAKPDRLPQGHGIRLLAPGFIPQGTEDMLRRVAKGQIDAAGIHAEVTSHYRRFALEHLGDYASTLRLILEADGRPVLLHCTSGKDRTGFGIALLLVLAGCDDETIIEDYLLTNQNRRDISFMFRTPIDPEAVDMLTSAHAAYIRTALETLHREQGPPETWLASLGFDAAERTRLREIVTEPAKTGQPAR